jgi:hypothetical protein
MKLKAVRSSVKSFLKTSRTVTNHQTLKGLLTPNKILISLYHKNRKLKIGILKPSCSAKWDNSGFFVGDCLRPWGDFYYFSLRSSQRLKKSFQCCCFFFLSVFSSGSHFVQHTTKNLAACLFVCLLAACLFGFYFTETQYRSYGNISALLVEEDLRCRTWVEPQTFPKLAG